MYVSIKIYVHLLTALVLLNSSFLPHCFFGSCVFLKKRIVPFVLKSNSRVIIVVFLSTTFQNVVVPGVRCTFVTRFVGFLNCADSV